MSMDGEFFIVGDELVEYMGKGGDVVIPDGVTSINGDAFSGSRSPASIMIPNSVTSIDREAFLCCGSLKSITIPESIDNIG